MDKQRKQSLLATETVFAISLGINALPQRIIDLLALVVVQVDFTMHRLSQLT